MYTSILKCKWHLPHTNNIAKNNIVLGKKKKTCKPFASSVLWTKHPSYLSLSGNPSENTLWCFCLYKKHWKARPRRTKPKEENVYQTRKLMSLIHFNDFQPKLKGEAYLFVPQQNSKQSKRKKWATTTCINLNFIPNQLKESVTTAKAFLKSFPLNTTS